jgi:hypothetical protein
MGMLAQLKIRGRQKCFYLVFPFSAFVSPLAADFDVFDDRNLQVGQSEFLKPNTDVLET